jgi:hypothetical protein
LINSCGLSWLTWFIIQLYPWRLAENGWLWFYIPLKDSVSEEYNFVWFDVWHCRKEKPRCFMQSSSFTVTKQVVWCISSGLGTSQVHSHDFICVHVKSQINQHWY